MKLTSTFTLVLAVLPCIVSVSALPQRGGQRGGNQRGGAQRGQQGQQGQQQQGQRGQQGQQGQQQQQQGQKGQQGQQQQQGQQNQTQTGQQQGQTGQQGQNNAGNGQAAGGQGGDPQTSTTLDPSVIAKGFAQNGQAGTPDPGQVPSLTSTNNFINFCALTLPKTPITNGQQITTGSCNPAPIGLIPSVDKMPSSKFVSPKNLDNIAADTPFVVSMAVKNLVTGNFVNAQTNYFAAPQQLDGSGTIVGHTHVVIEKLDSLQQTTPTDPKLFAFFKGVNTKAVNGVVTANVDKGLPAGAYRCCSINTSANHAAAIVPVAQRGSLDDCIYFTTGGAGGNNGQTGQNNGQQGGAAGTGQQGGATGTGQQGGATGTTGTAGTAGTGQQGGAAGNSTAGQTGQTGKQGQTGQQGQKGAQGQTGQKGQTQQGQQGQAQQGQKGQQGQAQQGQKGQQQAQQGQKGQQAQGQKAQPQPQPAKGQKAQGGRR